MHRSIIGSSRPLLATVAVVALAACIDSSLPTAVDMTPDMAIVDGTNVGNEHFFWLPPTVRGAPQFDGDSNPDAQPLAEICRMADGACSTLIASFNEASGLTYEATSESYRARWYFRLDDVADGDELRMEVSASGVTLGYADILVVDKVNGQLFNETQEEFLTIAEDNGRKFLPIAFRIEQGALAGLFVLEPWDGPLLDSEYPWTTTNPNTGIWTIGIDNAELHWERHNAGGSGRTVMAILDVNAAYDPDMVLSFDIMPLGSSVRNGAGDNGLEWAAKVEAFVVCDDGHAEYLAFGYNDDGGPAFSQFQGTYQGLPADITVIGHPASPLGVWQRDQAFRLGDYVSCTGTLTQLWIGGGGWDFEGRSDNLRLEIPG